VARGNETALFDHQIDFINTMCANEVRAHFKGALVAVALQLFLTGYLLSWDLYYMGKLRACVKRYAVAARAQEAALDTEIYARGRRLLRFRLAFLALYLLTVIVVSSLLFVTFASNSISSSLAAFCGTPESAAHWRERYPLPADTPAVFNCAARNGAMIGNVIALVHLCKTFVAWRILSSIWYTRRYVAAHAWAAAYTEKIDPDDADYYDVGVRAGMMTMVC
jgi:hypothetical protein